MSTIVASDRTGGADLKRPAHRLRTLLAVLAAGGIGLLAWAWWSGALGSVLTRESVRALIDGAGPWGPLLVVALMTVAVVVSPLPSAPIAVAAGAAYGHVLGTVAVAAGAELGAIIAFAIARFAGRDAVRKWFGDRLDAGLFGSQNALMVTVFLSRLMPFVSFDMVSYAAGLTRLQLWRFAVATLAGILPASFVLAHLGGELAGSEGARGMIPVLLLGLVTGAPLIWAAWKRRSSGSGGPRAQVEQDQGEGGGVQ